MSLLRWGIIKQLKYNSIQLRIEKFPLTRGFVDSFYLCQFHHPPDVAGSIVQDDEGPPQPVCLHSITLLDEVVPYQRQIVPPSISVEAWVQGYDVYGLLYPSFKPSGFCHQYHLAQRPLQHLAEWQNWRIRQLSTKALISWTLFHSGFSSLKYWLITRWG